MLNLAARAGVRYSMENPYVYIQANATGNLDLLEEARLQGAGEFVLASTSSLNSGQAMLFWESLPVASRISPSATTENAAESIACTYHHLCGIDVSVAMCFAVYGPAGRSGMSYLRFIHAIETGTPVVVCGDGERSRDFTFVDDIARGGAVLAAKRLGYGIVNLGGGIRPFSIGHVVRSLEVMLGKSAVVDCQGAHVADMKSTWANATNAKALLGWEPTVGLEEGLQRCVDWYRGNRSWLQKLPGVCGAV
ncbi:NAD-dependent epimerase/dehydratase family protein [Rhodopirellula islandica]|nr:NAD-dependent epimerase/dehydratase family protein [Rhodopirellula islandica]